MNRVHIIGGGFSGLSVAYFLSRVGIPVEVFEKSERVGGLISTRVLDWGMVETAANGLLNSPTVEELFADLGLQKAERPAVGQARFIYRGKARRWPLSILETFQFFCRLVKMTSAHYR